MTVKPIVPNFSCGELNNAVLIFNGRFICRRLIFLFG